MVQTRSHGYIESTAPFMKFLRAEYSDVFPVLETYTSTRRSKQGQCIQIYKMVPGILGSIHYPKLPFKEKVRILKALGRAYGAIWDMEPRLGDSVQFPKNNFTADLPRYSNYPYSNFGMGGNFSSVVEYLREWIQMNLRSLEASNLSTLKEYKTAYLPRIKDFIERGMKISHTIEAVPQVIMHSNLGPQNILLSKDTPTRIVAILDWEIYYRHPFMVSVPKIIESFFRISKSNGTQGPCYERTVEL